MLAERPIKTKHMNIRTGEEEYRRIREFARFQGKSVSSLVMDSLREKIEDREDIEAFDEYRAREAQGETETVSFAEMARR